MLNNEDNKTAPVAIKNGGDVLSGKKAANHFIQHYQSTACHKVDENRSREVRKELRKIETEISKGKQDVTNMPFTINELNEELAVLKQEITWPKRHTKRTANSHRTTNKKETNKICQYLLG